VAIGFWAARSGWVINGATVTSWSPNSSRARLDQLGLAIRSDHRVMVHDLGINAG
jgi:hypothetical protein